MKAECPIHDGWCISWLRQSANGCLQLVGHHSGGQQQARRDYRPVERSDLGILWQMLQLHLHPNSPAAVPGSASSSELVLTRAEFQLAFGLGWNAVIIKRIFDMLDTDGDGSISLDDFSRGLFPLASVRATLDEKLRFLFESFDLDGSGFVSREDLLVHLHLYASQGLYENDCSLSTEQLESVVRATFEQAAAADAEGATRGGQGMETAPAPSSIGGRTGRGESGVPDGISWAAFDCMLRSRPQLVEQMLSRLGLDIARAIADLVLSIDERWFTVSSGGGRARSASAGVRQLESNEWPLDASRWTRRCFDPCQFDLCPFDHASPPV